MRYLWLGLVTLLALGLAACVGEPAPTPDAVATQIAVEKAAHATMTAEMALDIATPAATEPPQPPDTPGPTSAPEATSAPRFAPGAEVALVRTSGDRASVWTMTDNCRTDKREGRVALGRLARIGAEVCLNPVDGAYYYAVFLNENPAGWASERDMVAPENYSPPAPTATSTLIPGTHRVRYVVSGTAKSVSVSMGNATGGTDQKTAAVPYEKAYIIPSGEFAYLSAQNRGKSGSVICQLWVDGVLMEESRSTGSYVIVSCSGSVGR